MTKEVQNMPCPHCKGSGISNYNTSAPERESCALCNGRGAVRVTNTGMPPHLVLGRPALRRGDWFPTYSGVKFYPCDPHLADIRIEDIAHALSLQCRFAGHVERFYSVAQHSVLVSLHVPPGMALEALLHDAAEAYCQDLIRPIKHQPGFERYREIEENLERNIAQRFGLSYPWQAPVKEANNRALMTERRDLYKPGVGAKFDWSVKAEPFLEPIVPWVPVVAEERFLKRFAELYASRSCSWCSPNDSAEIRNDCICNEATRLSLGGVQ